MITGGARNANPLHLSYLPFMCADANRLEYGQVEALAGQLSSGCTVTQVMGGDVGDDESRQPEYAASIASPNALRSLVAWEQHAASPSSPRTATKQQLPRSSFGAIYVAPAASPLLPDANASPASATTAPAPDVDTVAAVDDGGDGEEFVDARSSLSPLRRGSPAHASPTSDKPSPRQQQQRLVMLTHGQGGPVAPGSINRPSFSTTPVADADGATRPSLAATFRAESALGFRASEGGGMSGAPSVRSSGDFELGRDGDGHHSTGQTSTRGTLGPLPMDDRASSLPSLPVVSPSNAYSSTPVSASLRRGRRDRDSSGGGGCGSGGLGLSAAARSSPRLIVVMDGVLSGSSATAATPPHYASPPLPYSSPVGKGVGGMGGDSAAKMRGPGAPTLAAEVAAIFGLSDTTAVSSGVGMVGTQAESASSTSAVGGEATTTQWPPSPYSFLSPPAAPRTAGRGGRLQPKTPAAAAGVSSSAMFNSVAHAPPAAVDKSAAARLGEGAGRGGSAATATTSSASTLSDSTSGAVASSMKQQGTASSSNHAPRRLPVRVAAASATVQPAALPSSSSTAPLTLPSVLIVVPASLSVIAQRGAATTAAPNTSGGGNDGVSNRAAGAVEGVQTTAVVVGVAGGVAAGVARTATGTSGNSSLGMSPKPASTSTLRGMLSKLSKHRQQQPSHQAAAPTLTPAVGIASAPSPPVRTVIGTNTATAAATARPTSALPPAATAIPAPSIVGSATVASAKPIIVGARGAAGGSASSYQLPSKPAAALGARVGPSTAAAHVVAASTAVAPPASKVPAPSSTSASATSTSRVVVVGAISSVTSGSASSRVTAVGGSKMTSAGGVRPASAPSDAPSSVAASATASSLAGVPGRGATAASSSTVSSSLKSMRPLHKRLASASPSSARLHHSAAAAAAASATSTGVSGGPAGVWLAPTTTSAAGAGSGGGKGASQAALFDSIDGRLATVATTLAHLMQQRLPPPASPLPSRQQSEGATAAADNATSIAAASVPAVSIAVSPDSAAPFKGMFVAGGPYATTLLPSVGVAKAGGHKVALSASTTIVPSITAAATPMAAPRRLHMVAPTAAVAAAASASSLATPQQPHRGRLSHFIHGSNSSGNSGSSAAGGAAAGTAVPVAQAHVLSQQQQQQQPFKSLAESVLHFCHRDLGKSIGATTRPMVRAL